MKKNKEKLKLLDKLEDNSKLYPDRIKKYSKMSIEIINLYNWDKIIDFCEKLNVSSLIIPFNFLVFIHSNTIKHIISIDTTIFPLPG